MNRERETGGGAEAKLLRRANDEGETTLFWRPPPIAREPSPDCAWKGERHARRRTAAYAAGAAVALAGSLVGLIGWARAAATSAAAPAFASTRLPAIALVASVAPHDELAAVLEAVDVSTIRATDDTAGIVRRVAALGSAVARGSPLVTLHRPDREPARKLAVLDALLEQYDESSGAAPAIDRAREDYERAVAGSRDAAVVRATAPGVVVGTPLRTGDVAAAGAELVRVAASVQLVMPAGDVDGEGSDCRVALLDRGRVVVDGRLVAAVPDVGSRTIALARFPADVAPGAIGRVKAVCR